MRRSAAGHANTTVVNPADDAPVEPRAPETTARRLRRLDGLLVGVVLLFAFLTALTPVYHSDFFLHAATGRLVGQGQYHFGADPFAFTTAGVAWINHSWLYDLLIYLIYQSSAAGGTILIVLKALMIAALAEVMLRTARPPGRGLWLPAVCVGLAVLTISPRLLLEPVCVSYFFLGLTCWLLGLPRRMRSPRRPFLAYWLIPPLCLLWVNLDAWFLLGPATVALCLLGDVLQDWLAPTREAPDAPAPGERRALLLALIASVAACLVNPYFYRAFTLPSELGLSEAADALNRDGQYAWLFLSPLEHRYFLPNIGLSVAGLAYFPLALLGAASFAAAQWVGRLNWRRLIVWAAFLALSAWHARAIPFFAVVAGPVAALNFLDFAARRAGASDGRGGMCAFGGRILTLLVGVALVVLTWPGWLEAQPEFQHVGWTVEPNRGLKEMAERIAAWRKDGLVEPDGRWFNTSAEALHYLAWYCPGERGFIDQRLELYDEAAPDYAAVRNALSAPADAGSSDPAWRKVFRLHDAHYLIWSGSVRQSISSNSPLWKLFGAPKEWPLLYLNGRTAVFGWRDPDPARETKADPFAPLEYNSKRIAFGPDAAPVPPGPTPEPRLAPWWQALWTPEPPRPPEADEAAAQLMRFESLRPVWRARNEKVWNAHWDETKRLWQIDGAAACFGPVGGYGPFQVGAAALALTLIRDQPPPPMPSFPPRQGEERDYFAAHNLFDFGPPSALYLSVRAARRALALRPDDPATYEALAQSYLTLGQQTRDGAGGQALGYPSLVRQAQIAAALHRALVLDPDREVALGLSVLLYEQTGFIDLAADRARERLRVEREEGQTETALKPLADKLDKLEKEVEKRQTTFELRAAGKTDVGRAEIAQGLGLGGKALEVLEKTDWKKLDDKDPNKLFGVRLELNLMLRTGRADEVGKTLAEQEALKDKLGVDPDTGLPAYEWLRVESAAATGDYSEADRWLKAIRKRSPVGPTETFQKFAVIDDRERTRPLEAPSLAALLAGHLVLREAPSAVGAAPWLAPNTRQALLGGPGSVLTGLMGLQCDLEAVRGWLALEAGHTVEARRLFTEAEAHASPESVPFRGRPLTRTCLEWLNSTK